MAQSECIGILKLALEQHLAIVNAMLIQDIIVTVGCCAACSVVFYIAGWRRWGMQQKKAETVARFPDRG